MYDALIVCSYLVYGQEKGRQVASQHAAAALGVVRGRSRSCLRPAILLTPLPVV